MEDRSIGRPRPRRPPGSGDAGLSAACSRGVYRSLFIQARNVLKKELLGHLRRGGFMRRRRSEPVATLVERHSRYVMLVKVDGKDTATVTKALATKIRQLPRQLRLTQKELDRVALRLIERPRETLNWLTPLEKLRATVASTG